MTSNTIPCVSICIPTYNRAGMIGSAIKSALDQTYPNLEIIVVDNASTDNTSDIVSQFKDERLTYIKNERNLGIFGNFNRCVELAHGEYLHILHSDDYIDSDFTKTCVDFMEANPRVMMTFTSAHFLVENEMKRMDMPDHNIIYPAPEGLRKILGASIQIVCPSVMMKKEVYTSAGCYSLEYPYTGDLYQWFKVSRAHDIAFIADATVYYRYGKHTESYELVNKTPLGYLDVIKVYFRIIGDLGGDLPLYYPELNRTFRSQLRRCLRAGIQSNRMKDYSPLIFIGFAMNFWSLIHPVTFIDRVRKAYEGCMIFAILCCIIIPGGRFCANVILNTVTTLKERRESI